VNRIMSTPRVSTEVITWLAREIAQTRHAVKLAEKDEQASGYDLDATIERRELEAQLDSLEYVQKYLAGEVD